jgi:hypothetical protein
MRRPIWINKESKDFLNHGPVTEPVNNDPAVQEYGDKSHVKSLCDTTINVLKTELLSIIK